MIESTAADGHPGRSLVEAAIAATAAPSVYNAQPWRLVLHRTRLELYADADRMEYWRDPVGRQLHISCGCALFNAMVAVAAGGHAPVVRLLPRTDESDLVADIALGAGQPSDAMAVLRPCIELRHTPRADFTCDGVDAVTAEILRGAAAAHGAALMPVVDPGERVAVRALHDIALADGWSPAAGTFPPDVNAPDPANAVGLFLLTTRGDDRRDWLAAGCALQRVLLELTARGFAGLPLMQVVECVPTRERLAALLGEGGHPQILLRTGRAPVEAATRRRHLVDVLVHGADWER